MCLTGLRKKEEKKSTLANVIVAMAAVIGIGTIIYLVIKYLISKYHDSCCSLCENDYDCDCEFDCCDCEDYDDQIDSQIETEDSKDNIEA